MALGSEKSQWVVNFDAKGNHLPYEHDHRSDANREMPATFRFSGALTVVDYERGRSAVNVIMEDTRGRQFYMSLAEFMGLVHEMHHGSIHGTWGFAKNGSNTTIKRVD